MFKEPPRKARWPEVVGMVSTPTKTNLVNLKIVST